ncbi:type II toxin-antitoxin system RelE/ParE family toxin [Mucilaginibacter terrigena]|uniref:Toxin n=1 Tax=Mucilaginibacter terrigena TaxID=2492395 RepID=A0A4Q5LRH3_9SPHI|nr:type II toxin-antitoxin system RelE/ParE family toxin [Mucilaginibacter terrigena]RYU92146.1 type II toxin-antitoxin system RelE/ParE family toxin [Mucilaginibacter terrigena]
MKYKISKEALKDLENIWIYTFENWSVEQADRYYGLLIDEIEYVSENPQSGKDYGHIREGYFRTRVKSHFIFYRANLKANVIEIIRVLHQQMDIDERLND